WSPFEGSCSAVEDMTAPPLERRRSDTLAARADDGKTPGRKRPDSSSPKGRRGGILGVSFRAREGNPTEAQNGQEADMRLDGRSCLVVILGLLIPQGVIAADPARTFRGKTCAEWQDLLKH